MKYVNGPGKWFIVAGVAFLVAEQFSATVAEWDTGSTLPIPVWALLISGGVAVNLFMPKGVHA